MIAQDTLYAVVALLAIITGLLIALLAAMRNRNTTDLSYEAVLDIIARIEDAGRQYAEVNAVLLLTEKFADNAGLYKGLAQYSRDVVAATLAYRVDALGRDIKEAQDWLSEYRTRVSQSRPFQTEVARQERLLQGLQEELLAAEKLAADFLVETV
ncbi:MAG TPA: hypothetical protein VM581_03030 [Magnetospirillaceae bacterium]|nr:hypothetical protein [Magnetospirillaceae bacterium]